MFNARSINNKTTSIVDHIIEHDLDIIAFCETWLYSSEQDNIVMHDVTPDGYEFLHAPRLHSSGGGVAVLATSSIHLQQQDSFNSTHLDGLDILVNTGSFSCRLDIIYRPCPSPGNQCTVAGFSSDFSDILEDYTSYHGNLLLLGDLNFYVDDSEDKSAQPFVSLLSEAELQQHVVGSTQISGHTLDLVISRTSDQLILNTEISTMMSDHNWVHSTMSYEHPAWPVKELSFRKLRNINHHKFESDIMSSTLVTNSSS